MSSIESSLNALSRAGRPLLRPVASSLLLWLAAVGAAQANQSLFSAGYGLTVGPVMNRNNLNSAGYNPANPVRLIADDEKLRHGVLQFGGQYELGRTDDVQSRIDRIDAAVRAARSAGTESEVQQQVDIVNGQLVGLDAGARFSVSAGGSLLTPILVRSETLGGVVSVLANAQVQAAGLFRSAPAEIARDGVNQPTGLKTGSAFDVKAAVVSQLSLGYGREIGPWLNLDGGRGQFDGGLRLNVYQAKLYRQLVAFTDETGAFSRSKFDRATVDDRSASAVAVDLGAAWTTEHYQLGATLYNLGSPKFKYPDPSRDANAANRYAASVLRGLGKVGFDDAVALKPHMVVEGSLYSANRRWLAQASWALNETPNFVGDPQQFATFSLSYNAERFEGSFGTLLNYLVPSVRVGVRKNLVGDKLASTGLGFSWGVLSLDFSATAETVSADGQKVPRSAGASLSIAEKF